MMTPVMAWPAFRSSLVSTKVLPLMPLVTGRGDRPAQVKTAVSLGGKNLGFAKRLAIEADRNVLLGLGIHRRL